MLWVLADMEFLDPVELERRAKEKGDWAELGRVFTSNLPNYLNVRFIGPKPIYNASWSDGKTSGRVSFVLPHPTDTGIVYIASAGGGVWKTTDGGNTWIPLTDNLPTLSSGALAFNPLNPNVIWYGTGEQHYCAVCFPGDGLFKSTDGGNTWIKVAPASVVGFYISRVIISPLDTNTIFVASDRGILRSTDGGLTWNWIFSGDQVNDLVYRQDNPNVLFAATLYSGIYKSTDGGNTWIRINSLPTSGYFRAQIGISPSNPDVIYVGFGRASNYSLLAFYKSTDGGNTWVQLTNTPNYLGNQGFYNHTIVVHPTNPDIVFAGGQYPYGPGYYGIVRSTDGGNTWQDITNRGPLGNVHPDIHHMAYGAGGVLWVACDGGVWKSYDNGNSWVNLNEDLELTQFYTIDAHPWDTLLVIGGTQDNGTPLFFGSLGWWEVSGGDGGPVLWRPDNPTYFYTTYIYSNPIYRFRWTGSSAVFDRYISPPWGSDRVSWANGPLEGHPSGPIMIAGTHRLWKSTDGGITWTAISGDLTGGGYLLSASFSHTNPDTIYTGSSDGRFYFTHNGGISWTRRTLPVSGPITDIWVNPFNSADVFITLRRASGIRVLRSTDAGTTWTNITGDLPTGRTVRALAVDFQAGILFVGTDDGVYYTTNLSNYTKIPGIPNAIVFNLDVNTLYKKLYVATHGRGVWMVDYSAVSVEERKEAKYAGNYEVFDVLGRKVSRDKLKRGVYFLVSDKGVRKVFVK
jgi:photosystem II stability/assembly factor-like uncharacterized protein